jgi:hypothetical protein
LKKVIIPSNVELIGKSCFDSCRSLREISFENDSKLRETQDRVFYGTEIERFEIPSKCEVLSAHSLEGVKSFSICKENPFFVFEEEMLMCSDRKRLIRYFGSESRIVVKKEVEVIRKEAFYLLESLCEVLFEEGSRLRLIEDHGFYGSGLREIIIPASVEVIGEYGFYRCRSLRRIIFEEGSKLKEIMRGAFSDTSLDDLEIPPKCEILHGLSLYGVKSVTISKENPFLVIEDSFLKSSDRKRLIGCFGSKEQVVVKKEVEVIGEYCFDSCFFLREITFEEESELREIGKWAFSNTQVSNLEIPPKCRVMDGSSLYDVKSFTVSKENPFLVVEDSFLKSSDRKRLIRYMGREKRVVVKKEVEVIGEYCFYLCDCEVVYEGEVADIDIAKNAF